MCSPPPPSLSRALSSLENLKEDDFKIKETRLSVKTHFLKFLQNKAPGRTF